MTSKINANRGKFPFSEADPEHLGLPARPFLWTIDQLSIILDVSEQTVKMKYCFFESRSIGVPTRHQMVARNIANPGDTPDWRIAERELIRWMRFKGFKFYDRGSVTH